MKLYSLEFLLFVIGLLLVYYAFGHFTRLRNRQWCVLLVGSLGFYFACGWQNLFFMFLTSFSVWSSALVLEKLEKRSTEERKAEKDRKLKKAIKARYHRRKWYVLLSMLILNLGVLGYLKYWNTLLDYIGFGDSFMASHLILPLGISFYMFMALSYLIDVYNAKYEAAPNYARFLLFVSWFPQLIQGPVNRWEMMNSQLFEPHRFEIENARRALVLIAYGAFKKFAIADVLAAIVIASMDKVDPSIPGCVVVFGVLMYTIQDYADFSGGIDMVRGVSQLFGIKMARNFNQPYFATSMADFWRRWHMSLGVFMRDNVFYPLAVRPSLLKLNKWGVEHLGKNVGRTLSACVANIIVFMCVGLWHGAETHFLLWGLYNGLVIASADLLRPVNARIVETLHINVESAAWHVWKILWTFFLVNVGRYFDRLEDPQSLVIGIQNTFCNFAPGSFDAWFAFTGVEHFNECMMLVAFGCIVIFIISFQHERGADVIGRMLALPVPIRIGIYAIGALLVVYSFTLSAGGGGFMYANF